MPPRVTGAQGTEPETCRAAVSSPSADATCHTSLCLSALSLPLGASRRARPRCPVQNNRSHWEDGMPAPAPWTLRLIPTWQRVALLSEGPWPGVIL